MTPARAALLATTATIIAAVLAVLLWHPWSGRRVSTAASPDEATTSSPATSGDATPAQDRLPTQISAHNLVLLKGPDFRIYIRWIGGELRRTRRDVNPSFDDPDSFVLEIQKGVIHANIGDISHYLNTSAPPGAPLKNISIEPDGDQLKLRGTVHKIIPLPIELVGTISPTPEGLVRFRVAKIDVLKVPLKWLLGSFHVELSDLVPKTNVPGIQIAGNDLLFDTQKVLPPPHIHGQLTSVRVSPPDLEIIYGNAPNDDAKLAQWHNFLKLSGGTLDFGKLTMHRVDLTMIDATNDYWFELDLVNYQAQLVNGSTRMTAQAGLEIFMPDLDEHAPAKKAGQDITLEWLKDRNRSLPPDISVK